MARIENLRFFMSSSSLPGGAPPAECYRLFTSAGKGKFHFGYH